MDKEFKLPDLGESIVSATVVKVLIAPGDIVKEDQTVLEIETDKATIEVPSEISGKVTGVYIKEGQKVEVGAVVFSVSSEGDGSKTVEVTKSQSHEVTEKPAESVKTEYPVVEAVSVQPSVAGEAVSSVQEIILPDLGDTIDSALVVKVTVKVGDVIKEDDTILEIETDKATVEVPSPLAGVISEVLVKEGEKAKVGSVIFKITAKSAGAPVEVKTSSEVPASVGSEAKTPALSAREIEELKEEISKPEVAVAPPKALVDLQPPILQNSAPAAPSVRRLAREIGVDINQVKGSGPRGRINLDDVKAFSKALHEGRTSPPTPLLRGEGSFSFLGQKPLPDFSKFGEIERKAMNSIRTKTAEHLSYAWATIPHVTQFDKADITDLEQLRKKFAPDVAKSGGKLTMTSILVKVITAALKQFPQFNSSVDMEKKEIVYKSYFNIGIAVDTEFGLIVPNIKGTDKLNLSQISAEMNVISEKARNKKIGLDDLQGGCFTISNLGGIGGTYFTPVVNSPEVAILGVSKGAFEPVYKDGNFVPRLMLPLSLSYDHRVIDGADAIRFLRWVIETLENPFKLLIEG